jgi:hypothetical protein
VDGIKPKIDDLLSYQETNANSIIDSLNDEQSGHILEVWVWMEETKCMGANGELTLTASTIPEL